MSDLPHFERRSRNHVMFLVNDLFGDHLCELQVFDDGHFRAIFHADYFQIQPGKDAPSKSQWSSLKKRLKRRDRRVFIFKSHGETHCPNSSGKCYFLDFGFFIDW